MIQRSPEVEISFEETKVMNQSGRLQSLLREYPAVHSPSQWMSDYRRVIGEHFQVCWLREHLVSVTSIWLDTSVLARISSEPMRRCKSQRAWFIQRLDTEKLQDVMRRINNY